MLEEKEITIDESISKKDSGKVFVVRQIPATKLKKLLFEYQNVFSYQNANQNGTGMNITINAEKKESLYFTMLEEIYCKTIMDGHTVLNKLKKNTIDAFVEDIKTLDYLVNEFWVYNLGEDTNLIQKRLDNLLGIC